jgi:integrase/recombinase XerD
MGGKHPKAPSGCFWRGDTLYGRTRIKGRLIVWSLHTDNPKLAAERRKAGKDRVVADVRHGDAKRDFVEVLELWAPWIKRHVGSAKTVQRYACSLDQLRPWLDGKSLADIDARLIAEIVRARAATGVSNATIKRDLVALSSVINFAIDQGWRDDNPVPPRMRRIKERRDPIRLPNRIHIDLLIARCPGMVADLVRAAIATGARQDELLKARRDQVDHDRRQLTVVGKGNKLRVIALDPYGGYELLRSLPTYTRSPLLFWHSDGEDYKNFASQFAAIVARATAWAKASGIDFRPFRFHDLRHYHAVTWLKDGRSIYDLQNRLGHTSIKTTEMYLRYLTPEEERVAKGIASASLPVAPALKVVVGDGSV